MKLRNLTPHRVIVVTDSGELVLEPEGQPARVSPWVAPAPPALTVGQYVVPVLAAQDLSMCWFRDLPEPEDGVALIVSGLTFHAGLRTGRRDLYRAGTKPAENPIRDHAGNVVAVRCLVGVPALAFAEQQDPGTQGPVGRLA